MRLTSCCEADLLPYPEAGLFKIYLMRLFRFLKHGLCRKFLTFCDSKIPEPGPYVKRRSGQRFRLIFVSSAELIEFFKIGLTNLLWILYNNYVGQTGRWGIPAAFCCFWALFMLSLYRSLIERRIAFLPEGLSDLC